MSETEPLQHVPAEYAYLEARLRYSVAHEATLRALLSNNLNVILAALKIAAEGEAG